MTLMFAGAFLCLNICIIFTATLGEGESLIELIFWPSIGFVGFLIGLAYSILDHTYCAMATNPLRGEK